MYIPQLDASNFSLQIVYLMLTFGVLYSVISRVIVPKAKSIILNRNLSLEENINASEKAYNQVQLLQKEKEKKSCELNFQLEKFRHQAIDFLDSYFIEKNAEINEFLSKESKKFSLEVKEYVVFFHKSKKKPCIDLAAFILAKLTKRPLDLKLLEKIYMGRD